MDRRQCGRVLCHPVRRRQRRFERRRKPGRPAICSERRSGLRFDGINQAQMDADWREEMRSMRIPTLLVHGDADASKFQSICRPAKASHSSMEVVLEVYEERWTWPLCHPPQSVEFRPLEILPGSNRMQRVTPAGCLRATADLSTVSASKVPTNNGEGTEQCQPFPGRAQQLRRGGLAGAIRRACGGTDTTRMPAK